MGGKAIYKTVRFTRNDLIHIRRFMTRACDCAEGKCPGELSSAWYYIKPILKRVKLALREIKEERRHKIMVKK